MSIAITCLMGIAALKLAVWFIKNMLLAVCHLRGFMGDTLGIPSKTKREHKYRNLSYFTPRFTFFYMSILTTIISVVVFHKLGIMWKDRYTLILPIVVLFFYFMGMHRRFKNDKEIYKEVIKANTEYIDLVKLPVVTIIAAVEFAVALVDSVPKNINEIKLGLLTAYADIFNAILKIFDTRAVQVEIWIISKIGLACIIGYFVSLIVEMIAFFVIQIMVYVDVSKSVDI